MFNAVWVIVNRDGQRYVERMEQRLKSTLLSHQFFVDSGIIQDTRATGSPTVYVNGLDHLEGETVAILADGVVQTQQVVTGGTVTLDNPAYLVNAGLPYNADLETLNIEVPLPDGTTQGKRINVSRVIMRLLNSRGGWFGPDFDNMHEVLGDYNTDTDDLYTDDIKVTLGQGYSDGGRFCFRQVDPLPVTILGVMPIFTAGGTTQLY